MGLSENNSGGTNCEDCKHTQPLDILTPISHISSTNTVSSGGSWCSAAAFPWAASRGRGRACCRGGRPLAQKSPR